MTEDQREIKRLQKELRDAQLERDMDPMLTARLLVQKGHQHLLQGRRAVYVGFIAEHRYLFPVEKMCQVLKVSTSG